jgi:ribosome modulation factor
VTGAGEDAVDRRHTQEIEMPEDDVFARAVERGLIRKDSGKLRLIAEREECAQDFDASPIPRPPTSLKCSGVGRDKDYDKSLCFYFNRKVTDAEMRWLHEVMDRSAALLPTVLG